MNPGQPYTHTHCSVSALCTVTDGAEWFNLKVTSRKRRCASGALSGSAAKVFIKNTYYPGAKRMGGVRRQNRRRRRYLRFLSLSLGRRHLWSECWRAQESVVRPSHQWWESWDKTNDKLARARTSNPFLPSQKGLVGQSEPVGCCTQSGNRSLCQIKTMAARAAK